MILYSEDLDKTKCDIPDCKGCEKDDIYLHPNCHTGQGLECFYEKSSGCLVFSCRVCKKFICKVAVAKNNHD